MTPPGPTQLLVVLLVVVLLFGAKKLPDLARSVGRSTRILKSELSGTREDGAARSEDRLWISAPFFFGYGCSNALPVALVHGVTLCVEERPAGEPAARERVAEERTTGER